VGFEAVDDALDEVFAFFLRATASAAYAQLTHSERPTASNRTTTEQPRISHPVHIYSSHTARAPTTPRWRARFSAIKFILRAGDELHDPRDAPLHLIEARAVRVHVFRFAGLATVPGSSSIAMVSVRASTTSTISVYTIPIHGSASCIAHVAPTPRATPSDGCVCACDLELGAIAVVGSGGEIAVFGILVSPHTAALSGWTTGLLVGGRFGRRRRVE